MSLKTITVQLDEQQVALVLGMLHILHTEQDYFSHESVYTPDQTELVERTIEEFCEFENEIYKMHIQTA